MTGCHCGLPAPYGDCCGPLHRGESHAAAAEQLMRSRYTAFALGNPEYLLRTWHPATRPASLRLDPRIRWTRLEVLAARGGLLDVDGEVHFRAHHLDGVLEERSRFVRAVGRWVYLGPV